MRGATLAAPPMRRYRAPMAFPRKLLIPGEDIVTELRPHWVAVAVPAVVAVVATVVAIWLTLGPIDNGPARGIVWLVWLAIMLFYPLRRFVWWGTSNFVVTTSRVIHREGFIAKRSMEIPLDKINDVRFEQNIFERIVGAGTLVIQSASESGRNEFGFIRHPEEVQKTIYHASEMDEQRGRQPIASPPAAPMPPSAPPSQPGASAPNVTTELERLADLRARGVLTEEEFQAQKARILGS
jgi:membrane protein YdbS with pleckstrin-like domain